jgi:hypothetical protein
MILIIIYDEWMITYASHYGTMNSGVCHGLGAPVGGLGLMRVDH